MRTAASTNSGNDISAWACFRFVFPDSTEGENADSDWAAAKVCRGALRDVDDDGSAFGLTEEEMRESAETLRRMAEAIECQCTTVRERRTRDGRATATALIRKRLRETRHKEIRITTLGNVDSGKSTVLGVLTKGGLDNGRGLARGGVFRHKHELETGRTSAISQQIIGYAPDGTIVNYANPDVREAHQLRWEEIVSASAKVMHAPESMCSKQSLTLSALPRGTTATASAALGLTPIA